MRSPLNRGGLRSYLVLFALLRGGATHWSILGGIPLIVAGALLHLWAKGCLRQNRVVAKIGPYRFVRHPFYLANALVDAGIAVMSGWWMLDALLPVWWLAIYLPVIGQEENYLVGDFGADYEQYRRRVPCLIPWRRPLPRTADGFRWDNPNITEDGAISRSLRLLAYPLLLFACMRLRADGLSFFANPVNLGALVLLSLWYGLVSRRWRPARSIFSAAGQS